MSHLDSHRVGESFRALAISVNSPVALGAYLRFKYGEHLQLAEMSIRPSDYTHSAPFRDDYLITSYLKKYVGLEVNVDPKEAAISAFHNAENDCRRTNHRFRQGFDGFSPSVHGILHTAARKISSVLGDVPDVCDLECKWGPGVTTTLKGVFATLGEKLAEFPLCISPHAVPHLKRAIETDRHLASALLKAEVIGDFCLLDSSLSLVHACEVSTVPKKATIDRTIAIEPSWNIFLQLGVGNHIRRRLLRVGVDLDDQKRNQRLAKLGSKTNSLATVDLSSASDTIAYGLVLSLLPEPWFALLDDIRSRRFNLRGRSAEFQKFSTMGNGFTFELESLIFWAIAQSVCDLSDPDFRVAVYGDDIIVPSVCQHSLNEALTQCGFKVNTSKTFWTGDFRESCGKHYFKGTDVTPIYQKDLVSRLPDIYRCANRIRRYARSLSDPSSFDSKYRSAWLASVRGIDPMRLHYLPINEEGDGGLITSSAEHGHAMRVVPNSGGFTLPRLEFIPQETPVDHRPTDVGAGLAVFLRRRARDVHPPRFITQSALKPDCLLERVCDLFREVIPIELHTQRRRGKYVSRRAFYTGISYAAWAP